MQYREVLTQPMDLNQVEPFVQAMVGPTITALAAIAIAMIFTRRIKRTEATIECSRRFQELYLARHQMQRSFLYDEEGGRIEPQPRPTARDRADAFNWYARLFSLIESEFDFYKDGLIRRERFVTWMKWRRQDFLKPADRNLCGVHYRDAWRGWKIREPLAQGEFVSLMDQIHDPSKGEVDLLVRNLKIRHWWRA